MDDLVYFIDKCGVRRSIFNSIENLRSHSNVIDLTDGANIIDIVVNESLEENNEPISNHDRKGFRSNWRDFGQKKAWPSDNEYKLPNFGEKLDIVLNTGRPLNTGQKRDVTNVLFDHLFSYFGYIYYVKLFNFHSSIQNKYPF
jgi:hypothetical protein